MRLNKWKSFWCICTSCTLLMSTAYSYPGRHHALKKAGIFLPVRNQTSDQGCRPRDRVRIRSDERSFHLTGHLIRKPFPVRKPVLIRKPFHLRSPSRQGSLSRQEALPLQGALLRRKPVLIRNPPVRKPFPIRKSVAESVSRPGCRTLTRRPQPAEAGDSFGGAVLMDAASWEPSCFPRTGQAVHPASSNT